MKKAGGSKTGILLTLKRRGGRITTEKYLSKRAKGD
jgi:hypothetical protein